MSIFSFSCFSNRGREKREVRRILSSKENNHIYYIHILFNHCFSQEERKVLALKEIKLIYASSFKNDNVIHIEEYLGKMYNEYKYEIKVK